MNTIPQAVPVTADGVEITDGLVVFTNEMQPGRIVLATLGSDGWFDVEYIDGDFVMQNGERVTTRFQGRDASAEFDLLLIENGDDGA